VAALTLEEAMTTTTQHLADLFTVANREVTAELFKIARAITTGTIATRATVEHSAFTGALLPGLTDKERERVALLIGWAMHVQHTATTCELSRKWRIARFLGSSEGDAIDHALAKGAEFVEQQFVAMACNAPLGAAAGSTDRLMNALAERIAKRVAAYSQQQLSPKLENNTVE
jgi:hypothetical protein